MLRRHLLPAALLVLATAGCGPDRPPAPPTPPSTAAIEGPVALHVALGAGERLSQRTDGSGDCPGLSATVDLGRAGAVTLVAYASTCEHGDNTHPGNGRHGVYRGPSDIPAERHGTAVATALGPATVFEQPYYECTNSCSTFTEPVAVIVLDHPADPAYPVLTAYSAKGTAGRDRLTALVRDQLRP